MKRPVSDSSVCLAALLLAMLAPPDASAGEPPPARRVIPLSGQWLFQRDGAPRDAWKTVSVPSSFQAHEGNDFHGVGWYRKEIPPFTIPSGRRVLLAFDAAAARAEVWWDNEPLGAHLGGWTPFRFDVTDLVRKALAGRPHEVRVRLDEKVGHNTQGFLPIIEPHFGGLWQEVNLLIVPETYINDLELLAVGNPQTGWLDFAFPVAHRASDQPASLTIRHRLRGTPAWTADAPAVPPGPDDLVRVSIRVENPRFWSPDDPKLYEIELAVSASTAPDAPVDRVTTRAAFRHIEAFGEMLRLNGRPLSVRGVLNWGYYPPRLPPHADGARFRRDLEFLRASGFNLMKFCLWVPPKRFLELADELGVLTWMEYPTWHPKLTPEHLADLHREFWEFFQYDRNHPSVILRSLTCETGAGADLGVIRELYELAHREVPGALVEDDSSWIGWNRIHDFYDDHPYGNNHTWVATLEGFKEHILAHGPKPLALGEAVAADTWFDRRPLLDKVGTDRPYWLPGFFDAMPQWQARLERIAGPGGLDRLAPDSLRYAMLMRKYQVEAYRREIPYGGYVISVLRDFPLASMGLLDYADAPKWSAPEWAWQGDTMLLLKTDGDRRSFLSGDRLRGDLLLSHFGPEPLESGELAVTLRAADSSLQPLHQATARNLKQNPGTLARISKLDFILPDVSRPEQIVLTTSLKAPTLSATNHWPLWVVPRPAARPREGLWVHPSIPDAAASELFSGAPRSGTAAAAQIAIAAQFDERLVDFLEKGGRVLLLPNGQKNSFPLTAHWFLRGAPCVPDHPLLRNVPRELLVELQHFDLASEVVPEIAYLEMIDPVLMLWDTHDLKTVKTHGLIFESKAGQGRLLVSAVRHGGAGNAAGRWLLDVLLAHLAAGPAPKNALTPAAWQHLKDKLHEEKIPLVKQQWRFKPDPKNQGLAEGWSSPALALDDSWTPIRIGEAWESQGYPRLDGWAWYRLTIDIPKSWRGREVYLSFEGVDDMYELYVNGQLAGKGGDLATRQDSFSERKSHRITDLVKPGQSCLIAVRVNDWQGAGGIFRPVTLGTAAFAPGEELLK